MSAIKTSAPPVGEGFQRELVARTAPRHPVRQHHRRTDCTGRANSLKLFKRWLERHSLSTNRKPAPSQADTRLGVSDIKRPHHHANNVTEALQASGQTTYTSGEREC